MNYLKKEDMVKLDEELYLIPITSDIMFKAVFINDLELLKKFILSQLKLDTIFNIDGEELRKSNIKLLNSELPKETKKEYKKIVDLYVSIDDKVYVEIEVNRELFKDIKIRNYIYADKLYTMLLEQGNNPDSLKDKIFIQINLNAREKNSERGDALIVPYDIVNKEVFIPNKLMILKYLEYYRNLFYNGNVLNEAEMWLVSYTARNFKELYELTGYIMNDKEREKYLRRIIKMCKDTFILHEWEKEKMELLVESERRRNALEEGKNAGFEDGRKSGIKQGISTGIEQNKTEVVRNMLKSNYDIKEISKIINLTNEEIMKIKESL